MEAGGGIQARRFRVGQSKLWRPSTLDTRNHLVENGRLWIPNFMKVLMADSRIRRTLCGLTSYPAGSKVDCDQQHVVEADDTNGRNWCIDEGRLSISSMLNGVPLLPSTVWLPVR
jgi:hypothetical protein